MGKTCTLPTGQSQYQVVGRFVPNEKYGEGHAQCKVYRMKLFAKNKVVARSRFWYFMGRLCRVKKANGQIISVSQVRTARSCLCRRARQRGRRQTGSTRDTRWRRSCLPMRGRAALSAHRARQSASRPA